MIAGKAIYESCLRKNLPYFGDYLLACQGLRTRHIYMDMLVRTYVENHPGAFINILEIGSWAGASATTFARSLKKHNGGEGLVICVDPWKPYHTEGQLAGSNECIEEMDRALRQDEIFELFWHNITALSNEDIVIPMRGRSETILPRLARDSFQIVFVDGDHSFRSVCSDIRNGMALVAPGGFLCGDDLEAQIGQVASSAAAANTHSDLVRDPITGGWYHPGVTLAVGEIFGPVSATEGFWYVQKTQNGWNRCPFRFGPREEYPAHLDHLLPSVESLSEDSSWLSIITDRVKNFQCVPD